MKFTKLAIALFSVFFSANIFGAMSTGTLTELRYTIGAESDTVYFKMTPMPTGVSQWFYVRSGSGSSNGCDLKGDAESLKNIYSTLLTAKTSNQSITINYCQSTSGYGLVNDFIQLN